MNSGDREITGWLDPRRHPPAVMTKTAFAQHVNLTPARISQYLSAGILDEAAIAGHGRHAKIITDIAKRQILARRDPNQAIGLTGTATRLEVGTAEVPIDASVDAQAAIAAFGISLIVVLEQTYGVPAAESTDVIEGTLQRAFELVYGWDHLDRQ